MKTFLLLALSLCTFGCSSDTDSTWTQASEPEPEIVDAGMDGPASISDDKDAGNP